MLLLLSYIFNIVGGRRGISGGIVSSHHHGIYFGNYLPRRGSIIHGGWFDFLGAPGGGFERCSISISLLDLLIWLYRLRREEMKENWDSCVSPRGYMALPLWLRTSPVIDPIQQE